jgi:hypothetical protein
LIKCGEITWTSKIRVPNSTSGVQRWQNCTHQDTAQTEKPMNAWFSVIAKKFARGLGLNTALRGVPSSELICVTVTLFRAVQGISTMINNRNRVRLFCNAQATPIPLKQKKMGRQIQDCPFPHIRLGLFRHVEGLYLMVGHRQNGIWRKSGQM